MLGNQPTVIGRVRVRAGIHDSLLTQLRIGRLLDPIELRPARLPSSAILCIRTLRDPLPGSLRLDQSDVRPPPAWQEALRSMLDRLAAQAWRPAREAVPASAEAVVFLDRSELLACLASDWCEGSVVTRWWWRSLLKQGAATQIVKELWRRDPQYVPAALQQLASKNKAADFVRALSDSEARQFLRGVAQSFSLPALTRELDNFETAENADRDALDFNQATTAARTDNGQPRIMAAAPWRPWVPECRAAELRPAQELFFGIALLLRRAPVKARAPEFQARVCEWQQEIFAARAGRSVTTAGQAQNRRNAAQFHEETSSAETAPPASESVAPDHVVRESPAAGDVAETVSQSLRAGPTNDEQLLRDQKTSQPAEEFASSSSGRPKHESAAMEANDSPRTRHGESQRSAKFLESRMAPRELPVTQTKPASSALDERLPAQTDEALAPSPTAFNPDSELVEEWLETELGGVFYLINLGLFLGLYGDFTTPAEPGIQLNIWDFVALLGRELVGEEIESDAIWPLLQRLAQREAGDLLGGGFDSETVSSFEFRVSSFELDEASNFEAEPELRHKNPNSEPETQNSKLETSPAVAAWLERLMPYVCTRLRQALGLTEADDPGPLVCGHRARVCLTPTHLDVFFSLAELPVEIRLSGLDRNPGWVPAAGRFVAFHFE